MKYEQVAGHLNKIARLNLKNNKKKVCWIYLEADIENSEDTPIEVCCVSVPLGRKFILLNNVIERAALKPFAETIRIEDIIKIRSSKE